MKKKRIVLTAAIITLGVNLTTIFAGTWAWFNANNRVSASGMTIKAKNSENVEITEKHIYSWDYDTDEPIETNDLNLEPYDCFITSRNVYARKFLRLKLRYPNGVPESTNLLIEVECTGDLYKTVQEAQYVDTNISNLIQFKYFDNKNHDINTTDVATIYSDCREVFESMDISSKFVEVSGSGSQKTARKDNYSITNDDIILNSNGLENYETELFIEYTYNEALLEYYQDNAEIEFDLNVFTGATTVEFSPDVTRITIDISSGN